MNFNFSSNFLYETKRKLFHLSAFFLPLIDYLFQSIYLRILIFMISVLFIFCDYFNLNFRFDKKFIIFRFFNTIIRDDEKNIYSISGASYFLISWNILFLRFSYKITFLAMSILIFSDAMAAIIGKFFNKKPIIDNKTLPGSFAFFLTTFILLFVLSTIIKFYIYIPFIFLISTILTISELLSKKIDINDNLLIPILSAFLIFFFSL